MSLFDDDIHDEDYDGFELPASIASDSLQPPRQSSLFIGHHQTETDILKEWNANRMPHAIVLNGIKGIGKATFAYRLARFIFKETSDNNDGGGLFESDAKPETLDVKPDHPAFLKIASGGHPDMLVISRPYDEKKGQYKNDIPVEDIRKIAPFLRKTSSDGGWRIVIVDDANTMNRNGQNAILKILEEPPKNALLILVTHGAGGLLPTIRSRCRFIAFPPLSPDDMPILLNKSSDTPIPSGDLKIITAMADGSIGTAISLIEDGGIEATNIVLSVLTNIDDMSGDQLNALSLSYGKSGDTKAITQFKFIIHWWFETVIDLSMNKLKMKNVGGLDIILPTNHNLQSLLKLHEDVDAFMAQCDRGNLDKRYMIYKTLRMIQG